MQCCRCGAPHTQAHPLIVAEARLLCPACLAWQDTSLRDGDGRGDVAWKELCEAKNRLWELLAEGARHDI